jgi:hypothetical protein
LLPPGGAAPPAAHGAGSSGAVGGLASGVLSVGETSLQGGGAAVRLAGTGQLREVRVILEGPAPLYWFEVVESAVPGALESAPPPPTPTATATATATVTPARSGRGPCEAGLAPAWAAHASGFDPVAFQRRVAALGVPAGGARRRAVQQAGEVEVKAGLWSRSNKKRAKRRRVASP